MWLRFVLKDSIIVIWRLMLISMCLLSLCLIKTDYHNTLNLYCYFKALLLIVPWKKNVKAADEKKKSFYILVFLTKL